MNDVDVLVIGGGISGLSIARLLAEQDVNVMLWERDERPGGKIRTEMHAGYLLEQSASMVMNFRPEVNRFLSTCGLQENKLLIKKQQARHLLHAGQLVKVPMTLGAMMKSPLWSWRGRLRLLMEPLVPKRIDENETVAEFIRRRLGTEFFERAMEPFIAGPLAADADLANACTTLPRLTGLEKRFGSVGMGVLAHKIISRRTAVARESFSFRGGMGTLVNALAASPAVNFRRGVQATELVSGQNHWLIRGRTSIAETAIRAKQVVLAVPAPEAAQLTRDLDPVLYSLLQEIKYAPISVVHLGFPRDAVKHPLDGSGFLVSRASGMKLAGCLWMSNLFPEHAPAGKVLISNYLGGARCPQATGLDDEHSIATVMAGLKPLLGISRDPEMVRIHRHMQGLPLYYGAYHARMQAIRKHLQRLPGLHLEGNYRGGVSVRDRIVCASKAVQRIQALLNHKPPETQDVPRWADITV